MENTKFILGLGSNFDGDLNISKADELLTSLFPDILFSKSIYTTPIGMPESADFVNQVAVGTTSLALRDVVIRLKEIEASIGRNNEDKARGIIKIDIDLIVWNEEILKPNDYNRDYVRELLSDLR